MRRLFIVSLGLNLALAGWIFFQLKPRPTPVSPHAAAVTNFFIAPVRTVTTNVIITNVPAPAAFHWRMIETNDYAAYVANLRAIGCPEKTIQDIVIADIEKHYAERGETLPPPPKFWQTATEHAAAQRQREQQVRELEREKTALIKDLLGVDWNQKIHELWTEQPLIEMVLGYLPETKALQTLQSFQRADDQKDAIREQAGGMLLPDDTDQLKRLAEATRADLRRVLSPQELDEFYLRLHDVKENLFSGDKLLGVDLTGSEYRELVRLKAQGEDPVKKMLDLDDDADDEGGRAEQNAAQRKAAIERQARTLLGEQRYAALERSEDHRFTQAYRVAKEFNLPPGTAIAVYDVRRAAEDEAGQVRADETLAKESLAAALKAVGDETQHAIAAALGEKAYRAYLERDGQWLKDLTGESPKKR